MRALRPSARLRRRLTGGVLAALALAGSAAPLAADTTVAPVEGTYEAQVTNSRPTAAGARPWMAALLHASVADPFSAQFCGATHIAPRWVVTAAHCTEGRRAAELDVLVGTHQLRSGGERVRADRIVQFPGYDPTTLVGDLALVRLSRATATPVLRIAVPGLEPLAAAGVVATVVGWGGLTGNQGNQTFPVELREGDVPILTPAVCTPRLAGTGLRYDPATMVCAGAGTTAQPAVDACQGDSGGPLVAPDPRGGVRQLGLVSWGPTCGRSPSAYTSTAAYLTFLESTTGASFATFLDIRASAHRANIERVALAGITRGAPGGGFRPADRVTRAQMATFLMRARGLAPVPGTRFRDAAGHAHEGAINAVAAAGIAGGFPDGTFRPDAQVSRAQMASFLVRALGLTPITGTRFPDIAGDTHERAINALAAAGIAGGHPDGTYRPAARVAREQMASFLRRAFLTP
jgi:hypothetical protein